MDKPKILKHLADPNVIRNLDIRHRVKQVARRFLETQHFLDIDTPILSPEIAEYTSEQFVVTTYLNDHYTLPQSPQIYKQILMIAGIQKYFQIAHCFRMEKSEIIRKDQMNEFMQIDIEMQSDNIFDIMKLIEHLIEGICSELGIKCITPFPIINGDQCRQEYGTDKPNLSSNSNQFAFVWIINLPLLEDSATFERTKVTSTKLSQENKLFIPSHHLFALPNKHPKTSSYEELKEIQTHSFDLVVNGIEICSGDLRITERKLQEDVLEIFGVNIDQYQLYLHLLEFTSRQNGGAAIGLDRLVMVLSGAHHIHHVNAFKDQWWQ